MIRGGGEFVGANFVRDRAVVRPAIPPPKIVMRSGLVVDILEVIAKSWRMVKSSAWVDVCSNKLNPRYG